MPYSADHKAKVRERIIECARVLFNRHGFEGVTIDQIMGNAGLTRGGFYNHFRNKEELYSAAVTSFLHGRGKIWRDRAGVDPQNGGEESVRAMIEGYLSSAHLTDTDGQCPMIALSSDVARSAPEVRESYEALLRAMIWLFETRDREDPDCRRQALIMASLCVGTMTLSRTIDDTMLVDELRQAARSFLLSSEA